ncbi:MAG: hypothetical protein WCO36_08445 [Actinomycetes bacterium]
MIRHSTPSLRATQPRSVRFGAAVAAVTALLIAGGCSSASTGSTTSTTRSTSNTQRVALVASSTPPTSTEVFTAKPGNVTIAFSNDTGAAYGLEVDAPSGEVVGQIPAFNGGTKSLTISVTSGSYTMWCLTNGQKVGLPHTRLNVQ